MKNMKRTMAVLMTIAMAVSCLTFMPAAGFAEEPGYGPGAPGEVEVYGPGAPGEVEVYGPGAYLPVEDVTEEPSPDVDVFGEVAMMAGSADAGTCELYDANMDPVIKSGTSTNSWSFDDAWTAAYAANNYTVKLLNDIDRTAQIRIVNKIIIFDVNGHTLNIAPSSPDSALVVDGGEVRLTDSSALGVGELNVTGISGLQGLSVTNGGKATVTNATTTGTNGIAVQVQASSTVTVLGDVSASGDFCRCVYADGAGSFVSVLGDVIVRLADIVVQGGNCFGVFAQNSSVVTVYGDINILDLGDGNIRECYGVYADNSIVTVYGSVYGEIGYDVVGDIRICVGAYVRNGGSIAVENNISVTDNGAGSGRLYYGVFASGNGSSIYVNGIVNVCGSDCRGVQADNGGSVTVNGNVQATISGSSYEDPECHGVQADNGSSVTVNGSIEVINLGGATLCYGATALKGGRISIEGDVKATDFVTFDNIHTICYGAVADGTGSSIFVKGNITAEGNDCLGAAAYRDGEIIVYGGIKASGEAVFVIGICGAFISDGSSVIIVCGGIAASGPGAMGAVASNGDGVITVFDGITVSGGIHPTGAGTVGVSSNGSGADIYVEGNITAAGDLSTGVNAAGGSDVTVIGDISASGAGSIGAVVDTKGKISIAGALTGETYINFGYPYTASPITKNLGDYVKKPDGSPDSSKDGYFEYKYVDGANTSYVWVRDPAAIIPLNNTDLFGTVGGVSLAAYTATAGIPLTLRADIDPPDATYKGIDWSVKDAGTTGATITGNTLYTKAAGIVTVTATIIGAYGPSVDLPCDFVVIVNALPGLTLTPSHVILEKENDEAVFTAEFNSGAIDPAKIRWSVTSDGNPASSYVVTTLPGLTGSDILTVKAKSLTGLAPATLLVTAVYDGKYKASATVEILPNGLNPSPQYSKPLLEILEETVTANKAKKVSGTVPIILTNQRNLSSFTVFSADGDGIAPMATDLSGRISRVKLYQGANEYDGNITASMHPTDDRYVNIHVLPDAPSSLKTVKGLKLALVLNDGSDTEIMSSNTFDVKIVEQYPKITLKADQLNLAFPAATTEFTATASDGSNVTIDSVANTGNTVGLKGAGFKTIEPNRKGTAKLNVTVTLDGYHKATKGGDIITGSVKVVDALPKVKLDKNKMSVSLVTDSLPVVNLVTGDMKVPFESNYTIKAVEASATKADGVSPVENSLHDTLDVGHFGGGRILIMPAGKLFTAGNLMLKVTFESKGATPTPAAKPVWLNLAVTGATKEMISVSAAPAAFTVYMNHGGKIADVPITFNANGLLSNDWGFDDAKVKGAKGAPPWVDGAVTVIPGINKVTLYADKGKLAALMDAGKALNKGKYKNLVYTLPMSSKRDFISKTFDVKITITANEPSFSIKQKGKLDVVNPASSVDATVTLKNAASPIAGVKLYDHNINYSDKKIYAPTTQNEYFSATVTGVNTFSIKAASPYIIPGASKKLSVEITLANGQVIRSWTEPAYTGGSVKDKPLTLKPVASVSKATISKSAVTLYKAHPLQGETIRLGLTTPANVKLTNVTISNDSLNPFADEDGFKLVRSGGDEWTICFMNSTPPVAVDKYGNEVKLKDSYKVKLELWRDDNYNCGPAIVTVNVNIR